MPPERQVRRTLTARHPAPDGVPEDETSGDVRIPVKYDENWRTSVDLRRSPLAIFQVQVLSRRPSQKPLWVSTGFTCNHSSSLPQLPHNPIPSPRDWGAPKCIGHQKRVGSTVLNAEWPVETQATSPFHSAPTFPTGTLPLPPDPSLTPPWSPTEFPRVDFPPVHRLPLPNPYSKFRCPRSSISPPGDATSDPYPFVIVASPKTASGIAGRIVGRDLHHGHELSAQGRLKDRFLRTPRR